MVGIYFIFLLEVKISSAVPFHGCSSVKYFSSSSQGESDHQLNCSLSLVSLIVHLVEVQLHKYRYFLSYCSIK